MGTGAESDSLAPARTGLLGADYALDSNSGRYRFARIYKGDQTRQGMRGPLGEPGLSFHSGDYLLAVNGREVLAPDDPDSVLAVSNKGDHAGGGVVSNGRSARG